MHVNDRFTDYKPFWRDVSIGISDGASLGLVFAAGLSAAGVQSVPIAFIVMTAVGSWAMISGFIAYSTMKSLWTSYQKSIRLQTDEASMQQAIRQKQQYLSALQIQEDIVAATVDEIREETSADAAMHWSPPTLQEARFSGIRIALTFIVGGCIVAFPFLFFESVQTACIISASVTTPVVWVMQYMKCSLTDVAPWFGSISTTILTILAAGGIYMVIHWIRS